MWTVIDGLTGSGKTWLQTRLLRQEWKLGAVVYVNYNVFFNKENDDINRYYNIDELYHLKKAVIGLDDAQALVGFWKNMPGSFRDKIALHRHHHLDFFSTTQDFMNMHIQIRRNVHVLYRCQTIFRFPAKDRVKPILQLIRVVKKERRLSDNQDSIKFKKVGWSRLHLISRYWTRKLYDTYEDIGAERFLCKIKWEKKQGQKHGQWRGKIYSKSLLNSGKARL